MKLSALAISCVFLTGCVATRYSPPLDRELTEAGSHFLESRSVVVRPDDVPGNLLDDSIARAVPDPQGTITIVRNHSEVWPGRGFQCFEPYLYVLTVGVIPADCTNDYTFEARLEEHGSTVPLRKQYTVTRIQGWVSAFLVLFPSWELGSGPAPANRALNTAVNEIARESTPK